MGSKAHGHQRFNCRCQLIPHVDVSDLVAKAEQITVLMQESVEYVEFTRYGRTVGAWRDMSTGQFVTGP
jgi:hypothetical protein